MHQTTLDQYHNEEEEGGNERGADKGGGEDFTAAMGRFYGCPSSRIVRVSRACGSKDRHSKVLTSKGLRDRRVRLSVNTAIQFYDLQDRLGYDQPSKAVEWLLKAAESSINELPPMSIIFPDTRKQVSDEKGSHSGGGDQLGYESPEAESAKAREGAAERKEDSFLKMNPISQTTSFTELLNAGIPTRNGGSGATNDSCFIMKSPKQWPSPTPMEYYSSRLLSQATAHAGQIPLTANHFPGFAVPAAAEHHQSELRQFSFSPDNLVDNMNGGSHEYNINESFSLSYSSGFAGLSRGTLQSNSSSSLSLLLHMQRFPDGYPPSFFIGTNDQNHQLLTGYEGRQQLCCGNERGKN